MKIKWNMEPAVSLDKETWQITFKILFNSISSNELKWFQMKILYRILGTRQYLTKLGIYEESTCKRCKTEETLTTYVSSVQQLQNLGKL